MKNRKKKVRGASIFKKKKGYQILAFVSSLYSEQNIGLLRCCLRYPLLFLVLKSIFFFGLPSNVTKVVQGRMSLYFHREYLRFIYKWSMVA